MDGIDTALLMDARRIWLSRHLPKKDSVTASPSTVRLPNKRARIFSRCDLPEPKKPGDPNPHGVLVVVVGVEERFQPLFHFVRQHVLFDFDAQTGVVVGFDDAFDRPVDRFGK